MIEINYLPKKKPTGKKPVGDQLEDFIKKLNMGKKGPTLAELHLFYDDDLGADFIEQEWNRVHPA